MSLAAKSVNEYYLCPVFLVYQWHTEATGTKI